MTDTDTDWLHLNRQNWDDRVRVHGASTLRTFEIDEVGYVSGKRLVHLQCRMGQDILSWARRGRT